MASEQGHTWERQLDEKYGAFVVVGFRGGMYRPISAKERPTIRAAIQAAVAAEKRRPGNMYFVDLAPAALTKAQSYR